MIGFDDGGFGGGGSTDYEPTSTSTSDDDSSSSSTTMSVTSLGGGLAGGSGVILDSVTGSNHSTYDPTGGDPTDPSTGTVTTTDGQTETIDLGTDRGQAVINSPVVDPESDDVTGSGTNPGGVQRETVLTGDPWNDAAENARVGRWGPAAKLAVIGLAVVLLGGIGLVGGD